MNAKLIMRTANRAHGVHAIIRINGKIEYEPLGVMLLGAVRGL